MIFIDTGPFLARYIDHDQYHKTASDLWDKFYKSREQCITSNFVLDEFFTLLARRTGYAFAADRARNILCSQEMEILRPDQKEELEAVNLFKKYADQKISFTDCISFVLMHRHKIKRVFTFDRHFKSAGFHTTPF